jgi:putative DeoR family transcriptional regulator (stage III sporulation protein D)
VIKLAKTKTPLAKTTTVHKDVTDRLAQINPALAKEARKVLDVNKSERHIRGGLATKEKYLQKQA